jgi:hypothetical protein
LKFRRTFLTNRNYYYIVVSMACRLEVVEVMCVRDLPSTVEVALVEGDLC